MGFLMFTLLLLPAMLLAAAVQTVLSPFAGILAPVLELLNDPVFVYRAVQVLLVWNLLVLAGLVLARRHMKRRGGPGWEWEYIHAVQGGRRIWRRLVCLALWLGLLWEIMLVLLFALLLSVPSFFFRF